MPVPDFTESGILPAGIHDCTIQEAQQLLSSNDHRAKIWTGFQGFLNWAGQFPNLGAIYIDGSYVTDKPLPNDVDVVLDITTCVDAEQALWVQAWSDHHVYVKQQFMVDFYTFVVGEGNDFSAFFQYVRVEEALQRGISPATRKGILRVGL
jgi:hypothetical protein